MKKIYTLVALAVTASAAFAQLPSPAQGAKATTAESTTLPSAETLINTTPEGVLYENMYHTANVYVDYGGMAMNRTYDGYVGSVVVSPDGKKIYMKDPFIKLAPGTWLVGDLSEDGTAEFKFPQVIYNKNGVTGYAWKLTVANNNIGIDETTQSVKFKWDGSGLSQQNTSDLIGMLNGNNEWMGYGASQAVYGAMTDMAVKPEDETKAQTYRMTYYNMEGNTKTATARVIVDGTDIYIGDIFDPGFWIKGTLSGSKASFPEQYMGVHANASHAYMMPYDLNSNQLLSSLDFTYNASTGSLSTSNALLVNLGKNRISALDLIVSPSLSKVSYTVEKPAKPQILQCCPVGYEGGNYGVFVYKLSTKSVNNKELNQDNLFYNIYLDDKLYTFTTSDYNYIKNDITDVPYGFSDSYVNPMSGSQGQDFIADNGQQVIFVFTPYSKLGVKAVYVDGDQRLESDIAEAVATGIDSAVSDGNEVKSVVYTDLGGARVANPVKGIYLKTVTYANGETKTVKVVK